MFTDFSPEAVYEEFQGMSTVPQYVSKYLQAKEITNTFPTSTDHININTSRIINWLTNVHLMSK